MPGIEVFNCLNRQTTGQDVSYSGLKDYLLKVESTTRKEAPTSAMAEGVALSRGRQDVTLVGVTDTWLETAQHLDREYVTSVISQDMRRGTAKAENERERDETRCRRNGRDARNSLVRGDPLALQSAAEPVTEARETGVEESQVEAEVLRKPGS